ncbi:alpha/beta fold hydrolase [Mycolicibacterium sp. P1-18]|uniref:alpha/beta fold hydrolase n=1 Tax=Mycolicibacterium sp. P1-18 TaxID=2024615 RepID=UPI0011F23CC7|nr:alpha/beta hydrolase [Mycolicibacterium sp. P1-18]KAA0097954.1 alpha/beta fold hydrolase [Mycolicibacterium sp. P1-18]
MTSAERIVDVGAGGLHARLRTGEDPALVFLHYWGGSHRTWIPVVDRLPPHHAAVTYDQRGWGASNRMPGPFELDQLADDALHVVESCDLRSFVLVGHSMGGKVAQVLAARRPAGLAGVVLVAPAPPAPAGVTAAQRDALLHAYDDAETVGQAIDHALTRRGLPPELRVQVVEDSLRGSPGARDAWPRRGIVEDVGDAVANIDVPVLVLAGDDDRVDPPATLATHLLPRIPTATMDVLVGTGHLSPLEVPDQVSGYVNRFVTGLASS